MSMSFAQKQKHLSTLNAVLRLFSTFDWKEHGYADEFEWLREMYGDLPNPELIHTFRAQFIKEGLL